MAGHRTLTLVSILLTVAAVLVGYSTDNGVDYWKIKNRCVDDGSAELLYSWGNSWGENVQPMDSGIYEFT